jgi:hypothetical protein
MDSWYESRQLFHCIHKLEIADKRNKTSRLAVIYPKESLQTLETFGYCCYVYVLYVLLGKLTVPIENYRYV